MTWTTRAVNGVAVMAALLLPIASGSVTGCSKSDRAHDAASGSESIGVVDLRLLIAPGDNLNSLQYTVNGPNGFTRTGNIDLSQASLIEVVLGGLPAGTGYTINLT